MKRTVFYSVMVMFGLAIFLSSCSLLGDLLDITFETEYAELEFTAYPKDAGIHTLVEEVLQSDIEQEIKDNGGKVDNLKDIYVSEASITVVTPGYTLDPYEWIEVYVSTPNVSELVVASIYDILPGAVTVELELSNEDIDKLLKEEEYTIRVLGMLSENVTEEVDMLLKMKYKVTVGP